MFSHSGGRGQTDAEKLRDSFDEAISALHDLRRALERSGLQETGHVSSAIRYVDEKRVLARQEVGESV